MSPAVVRPRLLAVTSLRFFAAFHVALFHMKEIGVLRGLEWLKAFAGIGYVGVSFFFVLSGFILVYTYEGRHIELRDFWQTRFARIYPAYLFSLLLTFPFFYFGALKMHVPFFAFATSHFALTTLLVLLLLQAWVPPAALSWNVVCWSLSVEAFFYTLFLFLLRRFGKLSIEALWMITPACWIAGIAVSAGYLMMRPAGAPYVATTDWSGAVQFVKFFPLVRLPEFLMGMAAGFLFLRSEPKPSLALPVAGVGLLGVVATAAASKFVPYLIVHTALPGPAFAALVYGIALEPKWASWLNNRLLVLFGDASYSFYLLHSTVLGSFFYNWKTGQLRFTGIVPILVWTAIMLGISSIVYRFIEEPARKKLRPRREAPGIREPSPAAAAD